MRLLKRIIAATTSIGKGDLKKGMIFKDNNSNAGEDDDILLKTMEMAIHEGDIDTITRLIANGVDGYSSLIIFAASNGYKNEVSQLLAMGANINAKTSNGFSALMLAVSKGHADVVDLLIEKGADINATWNSCVGLTILMMAAFQGHAHIVTQLLTKNADVNTTNLEGLTALMLASRNGHEGIVEMLKKVGATDERR